MVIGNPAENCLWNWKYYHSHHNIYFLYYCLWLIIEITLFQTTYIMIVIHRNDLHLPQSTLAMYQKGVYYSGIKVFNGLPRTLKDISSKPGKFKIALRKFLQTGSFYSLDEFSDNQWYSLVSIPLSYIFISIYSNIFCVIFTSILCISVLYH